MKYSKSIVSVFLFTVLFTLNSEAQNKDCTAYFPMEEGAEFEITSYNSKGKIQGRAEHKVVNVNSISGGTEVTVSSTMYDKKDEEVMDVEYNVRCKDGTYEFDMSGFLNSQMEQMNTEATVEGDFLEIPNNPQVGQRLKDGEMTININEMMSMSTQVTERVVEGKETMETPAGSFDCIIITYNTQTKMVVNIKSSSKDWFAEGVGMVRSEYYDKNGKLKGYSLLTKFSK